MRIESIFVRGTNWIGDAVMTTPALQRLRRSFPESRIILITSVQTLGLFQDAPFIDEVEAYDRQPEGSTVFFKAVGKLRSRKPDLAILFQNAFEAALLARLSGAGIRVGYAEQWRGPLLTHRLYRGPQHRNRHQINDYLDIVAECERICLDPNFQPVEECPLPELFPLESNRLKARELLDQSGIFDPAGPIIMLNAGATNSRAKCWPAENYARLADKMNSEMNSRIILIGGRSEVEYSEKVISLMKTSTVLNLTGKTEIGDLMGLLEICDLLISNDTGPAHMAAALSRPVLTIFGPTNEFETAPTGTNALLVRAEGIECARCMHRDCPIDHRCMTRISVQEIFDLSVRLLEKASPLSKPLHHQPFMG